MLTRSAQQRACSQLTYVAAPAAANAKSTLPVAATYRVEVLELGLPHQMERFSAGANLVLSRLSCAGLLKQQDRGAYLSVAVEGVGVRGPPAGGAEVRTSAISGLNEFAWGGEQLELPTERGDRHSLRASFVLVQVKSVSRLGADVVIGEGCVSLLGVAGGGDSAIQWMVQLRDGKGRRAGLVEGSCLLQLN